MPTRVEMLHGLDLRALALPAILVLDPFAIQRDARRALGGEVKGVVARLVHAQPASEADVQPAVHAGHVEREAFHRRGAHRRRLVQLRQRAHALVPDRGLQRRKDARFAQEIMREVEGLRVRQVHPRHPARGPRLVRFEQKRPQPVERPFLHHLRQRSRGHQIRRTLLLRRMTRHAADAVIQALPARHRRPIRRHPAKLRLPLREQEMRQLVRRPRALPHGQAVQQIRHHRPRHCLVRRSQPLAQPLRAHPFLQSDQRRSHFRQNPRRLFFRRRMTRRAIPLPHRHRARLLFLRQRRHRQPAAENERAHHAPEERRHSCRRPPTLRSSPFFGNAGRSLRARRSLIGRFARRRRRQECRRSLTARPASRSRCAVKCWPTRMQFHAFRF